MAAPLVKTNITFIMDTMINIRLIRLAAFRPLLQGGCSSDANVSRLGFHTSRNGLYSKKKGSHKKKNHQDMIFSHSSQQSLRNENSSGGQRVSLERTRAKDSDVESSTSRPFIQQLRERYREASRSVVLRTSNPEATVRSLSSFGPLKYAHCISSDKQYLLAEFASEACVQKVQSSATFFAENRKFPLVSRSLFDENRGTYNSGKNRHVLLENDWHTEPHNTYPPMASLDEELKALSMRRSLNDLDLRKRFLSCLMVEDLVRPFLPEARVLPYGSCINSFGWWDSDLDMMLCLQGDPYLPDAIRKPQTVRLPTSFKFLTEVFLSDRMLGQKTLTLLASLMEVAPRFNKVHRILNARRPIVRFYSPVLNLHCDVSMEAMDSIKMSELLFLYSSIEPRTRHLLSGIKQWAVSHELTSSGEHPKVTTIGLVSLLIFFLQTRGSNPVLPTLRQMQEKAAPTDVFHMDGVVYALPSNPALLPKSDNTETLESLLHGFFTFYSEFDFESQALSLIEGQSFPKPSDGSPLYVENPLCVGHNICQNVSSKNLDTLTSAMKIAATQIETFATSELFSSPASSSPSSSSSLQTDSSPSSVLLSSSSLSSPSSSPPSSSHAADQSRLSVLLGEVAYSETNVEVELDNLFDEDTDSKSDKADMSKSL